MLKNTAHFVAIFLDICKQKLLWQTKNKLAKMRNGIQPVGLVCVQAELKFFR
jgi:hypothetical protein